MHPMTAAVLSGAPRARLNIAWVEGPGFEWDGERREPRTMTNSLVSRCAIHMPCPPLAWRFQSPAGKLKYPSLSWVCAPATPCPTPGPSTQAMLRRALGASDKTAAVIGVIRSFVRQNPGLWRTANANAGAQGAVMPWQRRRVCLFVCLFVRSFVRSFTTPGVSRTANANAGAQRQKRGMGMGHLSWPAPKKIGAGGKK